MPNEGRYQLIAQSSLAVLIRKQNPYILEYDMSNPKQNQHPAVRLLQSDRHLCSCTTPNAIFCIFMISSYAGESDILELISTLQDLFTHLPSIKRIKLDSITAVTVTVKEVQPPG
jgi:hypothetical protein